MGTKQVKIFLASSSELKEDRVAFELELGRRNHSWIRKGIYLELIIWEDFIDAMSQDRLQGEYNKAIEECELFVMLFFTKVGKYTAEEFEVAFKKFKETNRPKIYTYFKDAGISTGSIDRNDMISLLDFQQKLDDLKHFYTRYENTEGLLFHFFKQLDKLMDNGFFGTEVIAPPKERSSSPAPGTETAQNSDVRNVSAVSVDSKQNALSDIERDSLEKQKSIIEEKLAFFREEMLVTSSPDVKFSLKKKIEKEEENLKEVIGKLNG